MGLGIAPVCYLELFFRFLVLGLQYVFSRVHATLYVTMLVRRSVGNHFAFLGV